jgi:hypothetical protein
MDRIHGAPGVDNKVRASGSVYVMILLRSLVQVQDWNHLSLAFVDGLCYESSGSVTGNVIVNELTINYRLKVSENYCDGIISCLQL